jgi:hypothetical protein
VLESTFKYPAVLRRMRVGPLAEVIDSVAGELIRLGYTHLTRRRYLSLLARFSRYAAARGCRHAADDGRSNRGPSRRGPVLPRALDEGISTAVADPLRGTNPGTSPGP